jgi:hypothetical protein
LNDRQEIEMLTKEGLLNLLDRIKEAVERGSEFGLVRYEAHEGQYIVHAQVRGFDKEAPRKEAKITAL